MSPQIYAPVRSKKKKEGEKKGEKIVHERCSIEKRYDSYLDRQITVGIAKYLARCLFVCFFFFLTVTYHGRRDADYSVVIGSRGVYFFFCFVFFFENFFFYHSFRERSKCTVLGSPRKWSPRA